MAASGTTGAPGAFLRPLSRSWLRRTPAPPAGGVSDRYRDEFKRTHELGRQRHAADVPKQAAANALLQQRPRGKAVEAAPTGDFVVGDPDLCGYTTRKGAPCRRRDKGSAPAT